MYTIDLLKGSGLPAKSSINNAIAAGLMFSIPVIIFIMMTGAYAQSKIIINSHTQTLDNYQHRFAGLKYYLAQEELIQERYRSINSCLDEVNDLLDQNMQWSGILAMVEQSLPQSLIIDRMEVKIKNSKKSVPQRSDSEKTIKIPVYDRSLNLKLHCGSQINSDSAVRKFQTDLVQAALAKTLIGDVAISSRKPSKINGINVTSYEMNCTFRND
jgi:hypothetical protein